MERKENMTEEIRTQKSLVEQIYNNMFDILEEKELFNKEEIRILRKIAYDENFKNENSIIEAIRSREGDSA